MSINEPKEKGTGLEVVVESESFPLAYHKPTYNYHSSPPDLF